MRPRHAAAALILSQLLALTAYGQSAPAGSEFDRVSGGQVDLITKGSRALSGSLGLRISRSSASLLQSSLGGTLVRDRVWFFASGERTASLFGGPGRTSKARVAAVPGDSRSLHASFSSFRSTTPAAGQSLALAAPESFLSLHATSVLSSTMFFTASFSEFRRGNVGH